MALWWKYFCSRFSDVFRRNIFSDVTLVSDDQIPFQAHRFILSASSPALKNLLLHNPHPNPVIFLRGISHQELDSILQFIYLGEVSVSKDNFQKFSNAAKDLQINQMAYNNLTANTEKNKGEYDKDDIIDQDIKKYDEDQTIQRYTGNRGPSTNDEVIVNGRSRIEQILMCKECQASFKSKCGLLRHIQSKHKGVLYSCHHCGYKATQKGHLKNHQKSVHEGMKYSCNNCDYQATSKMGLLYHTRSKHYGIVYTCQYCNYEAKQQNHLKNHEESFHEGVRYSCNKCDYKGTRKTSLKSHKQTKHFIKSRENLKSGIEIRTRPDLKFLN